MAKLCTQETENFFIHPRNGRKSYHQLQLMVSYGVREMTFKRLFLLLESMILMLKHGNKLSL